VRHGEAEERALVELQAGRDEIRKRRRVAFLLLALPFFVVCSLALLAAAVGGETLRAHVPSGAMLVLFLLSVAAATIGWLRMSSVLCPRCGRAMFWTTWLFFNPLRRTCGGCGLVLGPER